MSNTMTRRRPPAARVREMAVRAHVDPRTILAELDAAFGVGQPSRRDAGERARRELRRAGLIPPDQVQP